MNSASSDGAKSPWTESLKVVGKFINVFICRSCKSAEGEFQVSACCNGYFCRKCSSEKEECPECRSKLKVGESVDLNVPLELCTKLLAVLNLRFETDTLIQSEIAEVLSLGFESNETTGIDDGIENDDSRVAVTLARNSTGERNSSCIEDDKIHEDGDRILVSEIERSSKQSLASQKPQTFRGFLKVVDKNVECSSSKNDEDVDKGGQKQKKRKREAETMADNDNPKDGDNENDAKKRRYKSSKEPRKTPEDGTAFEQATSSNSETTTDSILGAAPTSTSKDSDSIVTPSRSSNLSRNSSAFLTPASECKRPGRPRKPPQTSVRKPSVSAPKNIPSRNSKKDLNSTLDSYFTGEPSETPASRQQRAKGANSVPGTPDVAPKGHETRQPSGSKKGDGIKRNKKGETALHTACIKGNLELARQILEDGMDPNVRDNADWTPLHEACNHGHNELVRLLLDHGADVDAPGGNNYTPLHDSAMNGRVECVRILMERGADANRRNDEGHAPTFYATDPEILRLLQQKNPSTSLEVPKVRRPELTIPMMVTGCLRPGKVVVATTGVEKGKRSWLMGVIGKLNWSLEENITENVTHVIASTADTKVCQRTLKYMLAVLMGKWIVTEEWLKVCETKGDWVAEEGYEVSGCSVRPDSNTPSRSRTNHDNKIPGIFTGCSFFLSNSISTNGRLKAELTSLIKHSSGRLLLREPKITDADVEIMDVDASLGASASGRSLTKARRSGTPSATVPYHATSDSPFAFCSYFVIHDVLPDGSSYSVINKRLSKVTASWIFDCISSLSLVHGQKND